MQQLAYIMLLLLLLVITVCGNWTSQYCSLYNGRCYTAYPTQKVKFSEAIKICSQLPYGVPVIVRSQAEEKFIHSLFSPRLSEFWMGLMTTQNVGGWTWITKESTSWSNWMTGEISNSKYEKCSTAAVLAGVSWRDRGCTTLHEVVCESRPHIECDCKTNTAQATTYNYDRHGIVSATRQCCCQKSEEDGNFLLTPVSDTRQHTIMAEITIDSILECAGVCIRAFYCIALSYDDTTKKCILLASYLKAAGQPLDLPTARGDYTCL